MRGRPPDRRADGSGNIFAEGIAFGDDLARLPHEALPFLRREFLGGEHDHRNVLPFRMFAECVEELEAVHLGHHNIEQNERGLFVLHEPFQRCANIDGLCHFQIHALDRLAEHRTRVRLVFHEQDQTLAPQQLMQEGG